MGNRLLLAIVMLAAFPIQGAFVGAQEPLKHRDAPVQEFVLGPGDEVMVQVIDMEELSNKTVRVDGSGFVDLPMAGRVQAAGLTMEQFKAALAAKLSKYINDPQVTLSILENRSRPVSVLGAVNTPGVQQLQGPKSLIEVISLAGGTRADAGPKVILTRQMKWGKIPANDARLDGSGAFTTASFSLDELLAGSSPAQNVAVEPGDVVSVPKAELIYVVGDVKKAGGFTLSTHNSVSLLQALSLAEGFGPDASPKTSKILRQAPGGDGTPREIPVDVRQIFAGKAPDVPLYANDILFIPTSGAKVATRRTIEAAIGVGSGLLIYRR